MTKTTRFRPPPPAVGGAIPFDGMELYALDEATDEELYRLICEDLTPTWLVYEAQCEQDKREVTKLFES